jgi:hypothetical protein
LRAIREGAAPPAVAAPPKSPDLSDVEAAARYHHDRLVLYRARSGSQPTSIGRLAEFQRAATVAVERLRPRG